MPARQVFIIPSWYPSQDSPIVGAFFKEQAICIGKLRPGWDIVLSLWGQGQYLLHPLKPLESLRKIVRLLIKLKGKTSINFLSNNVCEYETLSLSWTVRILNGNYSQILKANERNFIRTLNDFGKVDIIHAHVSFPGGLIAMNLSEKFKVPYIITEHMGPFPFECFLTKDGYMKQMISKPLKNASAIIAVSPSLAKRMHSLGLPKPTYIPNMVDETFFMPVQNRGETKFKFFTLGEISELKGIPDLLKAIKVFVDSRSITDEFEFVIGGSGKNDQFYWMLAEKLGLQKCVTWLGMLTREQVRMQFQQCDCFILPSHIETFGVVYAEAIACGKPIIVTRCGGPEYIVTKENGLLVDVGDIDQIALAIQYMYNNHINYDYKIIRNQFMNVFSREAVVTQIEKTYNEVIAKTAK